MGTIARATGHSPSVTITHLRLAGLVAGERRGKFTDDRLQPRATRAALLEVEALIKGKWPEHEAGRPG